MSNYVYDTGGNGIALLMVDGAALDGVAISNVSMENAGTPIFIRLGNRARPMPDEDPPGMGSMRDIVISGVEARGAGPVGCAISGIPGEYIQNLTLRDIRIRFAGGGTLEDAKEPVPEKETQYPSQRMFGTLPAYGMFIRHVRNLAVDGLDLSYDPEVGEQRPAIVLDDVIDAHLTKLHTAAVEQMPPIRMVNCQGALSIEESPGAGCARGARDRDERYSRPSARGDCR